jgi:hypothetical protein
MRTQNTLTAGDAKLVEAAFEAQLARALERP